MAKKARVETLAAYLNRRFKHLVMCDQEIEDHLTQSIRDVLERLDRGEYSRDDPALGRLLFNLDIVMANTHRYCLLIAVCSFLEEAVKAISRVSIADYAAKIKKVRGKRLNWLQKHIRLLRQESSFASGKVQSQIRKFNDFIRLRNCVVHSWGKISGDRDGRAVRRATKRVEDAGVFSDGYLAFGDQVVINATLCAEEIKDAFLEHVLT